MDRFGDNHFDSSQQSSFSCYTVVRRYCECWAGLTCGDYRKLILFLVVVVVVVDVMTSCFVLGHMIDESVSLIYGCMTIYQYGV